MFGFLKTAAKKTGFINIGMNIDRLHTFFPWNPNETFKHFDSLVADAKNAIELGATEEELNQVFKKKLRDNTDPRLKELIQILLNMCVATYADKKELADRLKEDFLQKYKASVN
jgi:hypothetical protein